MADFLKDENLVTKYRIFLEDNYKSDIESIALIYPAKRSLIIDFEVLDRTSPDLADGLLELPYKHLFNAEEAVKQIDTAVGKIELHIRIKNLPDICKIDLRNIRAEHVGKLVSIEGLVKKRTEIRADVIIGAFQCQKCQAIIKEEQTSSELLQPPSECYKTQGGCGRPSTFKFIHGQSILMDSQKIQLHENPEGLRGGEQPGKITVFFEDDLVDVVCPGDRVRIIGVLSLLEKRKGMFALKSFGYAINAWGNEPLEYAYDEVEITEDDEREIVAASKDPMIYKKIIQSIAPAIYGMTEEKSTLMFQMFGGTTKTTANGMRIRGDIHVLLIGDPGKAKSQLLYQIAQMSPRSVVCTGKGVSSAGLTASVNRDEFGDGQWTLDAGALVLADMGLVCIDEIDKMNVSDRDALHPAMEKQEIHISKAGINATMKTRCAVLAAANPKHGRFDEFIPIPEQINMPPTLLSRFDIILPVFDKPDREDDAKLATHILNVHINPKGENIAPSFSIEFLRKYIAYAKQNIEPKLTAEASECIISYYVDLRSSTDKSVAITPRQLEALIRLTEASAKVRLSNDADVDDARKAICLMDYYLRKVGVDRETGNFDIDMIEIGHSRTQQQRMRIMIDIINRLCKEAPDSWAKQEDIIHEAEIEGIDAAKAEGALKHLEQERRIENHSGKYRVIT
jgi:replicative DNA helicase Mcm